MQNNIFYNFEEQKEMEFAEYYAQHFFGKNDDQILTLDEKRIVFENAESFVDMHEFEKYLLEANPEAVREPLFFIRLPYALANYCARVKCILSKTTPEELDDLRDELQSYAEKQESEPCFICGFDKHFTQIFIHPSIPHLVGFCGCVGTSRPLTQATTVWLCKHHHKMISDQASDDFDGRAFEAEIDKVTDIDELNNHIALQKMILDGSKNLKRMISKESVKLAFQRIFRKKDEQKQ